LQERLRSLEGDGGFDASGLQERLAELEGKRAPQEFDASGLQGRLAELEGRRAPQEFDASGLLSRLAALEGAGGFDASGLQQRLAELEGAGSFDASGLQGRLSALESAGGLAEATGMGVLPGEMDFDFKSSPDLPDPDAMAFPNAQPGDPGYGVTNNGLDYMRRKGQPIPGEASSGGGTDGYKDPGGGTDGIPSNLPSPDLPDPNAMAFPNAQPGDPRYGLTNYGLEYMKRKGQPIPGEAPSPPPPPKQQVNNEITNNALVADTKGVDPNAMAFPDAQPGEPGYGLTNYGLEYMRRKGQPIPGEAPPPQANTPLPPPLPPPPPINEMSYSTMPGQSYANSPSSNTAGSVEKNTDPNAMAFPNAQPGEPGYGVTNYGLEYMRRKGQPIPGEAPAAPPPPATADMTAMQNPYVFGGYGAPPSMPYAGMATPQIPSIMGMAPPSYYGGSAQPVGMADPTQKVS
jgi:uncharacterized coiled-coil protein SlyX